MNNYISRYNIYLYSNFTKYMHTLYYIGMYIFTIYIPCIASFLRWEACYMALQLAVLKAKIVLFNGTYLGSRPIDRYNIQDADCRQSPYGHT